MAQRPPWLTTAFWRAHGERGLGRIPARLRTPKASKIAVGGLALIFGALVLILVVFDWNWLRGPVSGMAAARLSRPVAIEGNLRVHPWSLHPTASIEGLRIGQPGWAGGGDMATVRRINVQLDLIRLLRGQTVLDRLEIAAPNVRLLREVGGRANWTFGAGEKGPPAKLPAIRRLIITDGALRIDDKGRGVLFEGQVYSSESSTGEGRGRFVLTGKGTLNRAAFSAEVTGGPLLNVSPDRPYPFDAIVDAGDTHIEAAGTITRPFDLNHFTTRLMVRGPDMNQIYELTGLAFPNTPPYRLAGQLTRNRSAFSIQNLSGRVGDSDLSGDMSIETAGEKPYLKADLRSRRLDFDDLAAVFGGAPGRGAGETASTGQAQVGAQMAARQKLFPDATLQVERIRAMNADVVYRADSVETPTFPVRALSFTVALKDGVLTADPLAFSLDQGQFAGRIRLDATRDVPVTQARMRLSNARIEDLVPIRSANAPAIEGGLRGDLNLTGAGNSVHLAAANANGTVNVAIPEGRMRAAFAELLGVNVARGLIQLLRRDPAGTPVRCAVAQFDVKDGVLSAKRIVFDTGVVVAAGSGTIDLETERMDLKIKGESKQPRLLRLSAPITLRGPLTAPKPGVEIDNAVAQGGIAAALGALVSPLAAVIPFVTTGGGKDADCAALLAAIP